MYHPLCRLPGCGTLGRSLLEGAQVVKLFGETIDVEAHIEKLDGISGHADMNRTDHMGIGL